MLPQKTFIVAELSANHNHNFDLAVKTIEAMAEAGADAVKIQTYKPESLAIDVNNEYFHESQSGLWKGYTPWKLFQEASTPYEWHEALKEVAHRAGLVFFSSPFDFEGVDFLEKLDCPIYKVASPEINDIPLIKYMARKGKEMIISTGMATLADISHAIEACREVGNDKITLLKCTSEYPTPFEHVNLRTIPNMKDTFRVRVGISDHTMGTEIAIAAVALGASVIEKHFILDRKLGGPDSAFSMQPEEFKAMVQAVRHVELALGHVDYELGEEKKRQRRALFYTKDLLEGEVISSDNVRSVRGLGCLSPQWMEALEGKNTKKSVSKGTPVRLEDIHF